MKEFFIVTNSFAAPFCSDSGDCYVKAETPKEALEACAKQYSHPCGLYAAVCYASADAYHKGEKPLAKWLCNHELAKQEATRGKGCYSCCGYGPGKFRINDQTFNIPNPKGGRIVIE